MPEDYQGRFSPKSSKSGSSRGRPDAQRLSLHLDGSSYGDNARAAKREEDRQRTEDRLEYKADGLDVSMDDPDDELLRILGEYSPDEPTDVWEEQSPVPAVGSAKEAPEWAKKMMDDPDAPTLRQPDAPAKASEEPSAESGQVERPKGDPYEYRKDGDKLYTRKRGSGKWIPLQGAMARAVDREVFGGRPGPSQEILDERGKDAEYVDKEGKAEAHEEDIKSALMDLPLPDARMSAAEKAFRPYAGDKSDMRK